MNIFWFLKAGEDHFSVSATRMALKGERRLLALLATTVIVFVAWANWAELDQVTRASGTVIASSKTQLVQSQEGGVLSTLEVREGDRVAKGQVLVRLDKTQAETSFLESEAKQAALLAAIGRLRVEMFGGEFQFAPLLDSYPAFVANEMELYKRRQQALEQELSSLKQMVELARRELELNKPLQKMGDVSSAEIIRLERQLADAQAQITNVRNRFFRDAQTELNKLEEELASIDQQVAQRQNRLEQTLLVSPSDGIVKNISVTTEGGVIRPGEKILEIVPVDDALVIEAKVSPADIAFITVGDNASVKIDAYDYTVYGDLDGVLTYISADTLLEQQDGREEPFYRIQVTTQGRRFNGALKRELDILPGMTSTVEVKTGRSTVFSYITKPLIKTLSESLGER